MRKEGFQERMAWRCGFVCRQRMLGDGKYRGIFYLCVFMAGHFIYGKCIKAGNDLQMPGCTQNVTDIIEGVEEGTDITLADLQFCVKNILNAMLKCMESGKEQLKG